MPKSSSHIDSTFAALGDPTRRAVVAALAAGPATVSDLARPFAMALPSFTQHLGVLEAAGLIQSRRDGRARVCTLNPQTLRDAEEWLAAHRREWEARLDRFAAHVESKGKEDGDGRERH